MNGGISESCYLCYEQDVHVLKEQNLIRLVEFIFNEHYKVALTIYIP